MHRSLSVTFTFVQEMTTISVATFRCPQIYTVRPLHNSYMLSMPYTASCKVIGSAYTSLVISVMRTVTPTLNNATSVGSCPTHHDVKLTYTQFNRFCSYAAQQSPIGVSQCNHYINVNEQTRRV